MLANVFVKTTRDRWKGVAIGAGTLGLLLLVGMSAYRDIDLSVYTDLPEVFRALVNIPKDADVGSLAYGAIYGSYGALTLAGLSLSMGSASIAGEERNGTLGFLLANPTSRTGVFVSKAASMVLLTGLGALLLWVAGLASPALLNVDVTGMHVGALVLHMFVVSVFFGLLATAIGASTGKRTMASGVSAGVMVVSFFATGLLPLVSGFEGLAKVFPWYYFNGSNPVINGVDWAHLGLLVAGSIALFVVGLVGLNRRDLRAQEGGVTLADRLRSHPLTHQVVDRLAGSTRVSRVWIKTASDHQGLLIATAVLMVFMEVMIGPMFKLIDNALAGLTDSFPKALLALFGGGGDMGTPEGWYQVEIFGMMAPIAVMVVTIVIGATALAGEEERRTMGLLLANPISRSAVVLENAGAMVGYGLVGGLAIFAGVAGGSLLGGLGMSLANVAATSLLVTLLGLVFGSLALALGAATGRVKLAIYGSIGAALVFHLLNAFLPLSDRLAGYARWSPFYYYLSSDPLVNGMHWGHGLLLGALSAGLVAASLLLFRRRDLRQTG